MIPQQRAGSAATIQVATVDDSGAAITATAANWLLYDERLNLITTGVDANFDSSNGYATVSIPANYMNVTGSSEGREIVVQLTTDVGTVEVRDFFVVVAQQFLIVPENSFVTYPEALALRTGFGSTLQGWDDAASDQDRMSALIEAHARLMRVAYRIPVIPSQDKVTPYVAYGTGYDVPWASGRGVAFLGMTTDDFDSLDPAFLKAIKRAQVAEANLCLGGDEITRKRQQGLISETVGESSMFFSSKPYLNLSISKPAYDEIKRYVRLKLGVIRG